MNVNLPALQRCVRALEMMIAIALAFAVTAIFLIVIAHGGELVLCENLPGKGPYVYRDLDGRKCWFPAQGLRRGREKPLEELRWGPRPTWFFENRWEVFEDARGWTHQE